MVTTDGSRRSRLAASTNRPFCSPPTTTVSISGRVTVPDRRNALPSALSLGTHAGNTDPHPLPAGRGGGAGLPGGEVAGLAGSVLAGGVGVVGLAGGVVVLLAGVGVVGLAGGMAATPASGPVASGLGRPLGGKGYPRGCPGAPVAGEKPATR